MTAMSLRFREIPGLMSIEYQLQYRYVFRISSKGQYRFGVNSKITVSSVFV